MIWTDYPSELWIGLIALAVFALAVFTVFVLRGPKSPDSAKKAKDEGLSQEVVEGAEIISPDAEPYAEMEEGMAEVEAAPEAIPEPPVSLKEALSNTQKNLFGRIRDAFKSKGAEDALEEVEEILYTSDLGPQTVQRLIEAVEEKLSRSDRTNAEAVRESLIQEMKDIFSGVQPPQPPSDEEFFQNFALAGEGPAVWMIVGVNGAGKTTTIGKLCSRLAGLDKKVLVAAGDTFRAAAGGQLKVWTERAGVEIFSPEEVKDPSAVAFDAISRAKAKGTDVVVVDTAGRLHTQKNLMEELKKMKRVMTKVIPEAPHEVLLVLDANSGQNALIQAKEFHSALGVTGVVLTKLDGTAKGGIAVGLAYELQIPIKLIGVGEKIEDLRSFSSEEFVESIL